MIKKLRLYIYISIFLFLALTPIVFELSDETLLMRELHNTAHTFIFGLLAIVTLRILQYVYHADNRGSNDNVRYYIISFLICFLSGLSIELIQLTTNRSADINDIIRNLLGIVSFLGFYYIFSKIKEIKHVKNIIPIGILSIFVFLVSLIPLGTLSLAYLERNNAIPILIDFNSNWISYFTYTTNAHVEQINQYKSQLHKKYNASVLFEKGHYSKLEIYEPLPDWSNYTTLCFSIYSDYSRPFNLSLRIHDAKHNQDYSDRFNKSYVIKPTHNKICIYLEDVVKAPLSREMDISDIVSIIIFSNDNNEYRKFLISNFFLS